MANGSEKFVQIVKNASPVPPPMPVLLKASSSQNALVGNRSSSRGVCGLLTASRDVWDRLFDEGYRADVIVKTDNGGIIYAHANIIGAASPVIKGMLKKTKSHGRRRTISICGVPQDAVRVFIRFLYSSCYEKEDMEDFVMHLLVLSHVYTVPHLKQLCELHLEHGLLTTENVIDAFQLSLLCDCPRLSLICHRKVMRNLNDVSCTEGWQVMKLSHPILEEELLVSIISEENRRKERIRKLAERKIYLQLYDAMEALVHICRDGCKTIGPHDKDFKADEEPCVYESCKGLELLVRHFAGCKLRVPGGCVHCKRMWQLLELHSRLCADSDICRVPLCRNFKEKVKKQSKKDEMRWKMLVKKVLRTKSIGGSPFFSLVSTIS